MAKTRIFTEDRRHCGGFTLLEALIVLAIVSLGALISVSYVNNNSARLVIGRTAQALIVDLKRMRLAAETQNITVTLRGEPHGYEAVAANITRRFPDGVSAQWNGEAEESINIEVGVRQKGEEIIIEKNGVIAVVAIAPISGRILRVR